jgi:lipopolysaccharide/colanic/teichoic acid biosynthesis glycosyltransferase
MSSVLFGQLASDFDTTPEHTYPLVISPWMQSSARRAFDVSVAISALLFCSPLFLIVAVAIRLTSSGPVLFRQRRMGRGGREFVLYKFRSMFMQYPTSLPIAVKGDVRITPVGTILRRFKLDELSQFWNVLKGDMSLVGPRPKLPQHESLSLTVRPGLTGAATLAFRDEEELLASVSEAELEEVYELYVKPAKTRLDFEYMQTATLASDFKIIWRTIVSCLCYWKSAQFFSGEILERPLSCRWLSIAAQHNRKASD